MAIPDTLTARIELFREKGRVLRFDQDLFDVPSWIAVMLGQNIEPKGYDTVVDTMDETRIPVAMRQLSNHVRTEVAAMATHSQAVRSRAARH